MEAEKAVKRASFDIDGVLNMGDYPGVRAGPDDIIITGRSFQEETETTAFLKHVGLDKNKLYMNPCYFEEKTRLSSGYHKAEVINRLNSEGANIVIHYEDDPVQAEVIKNSCHTVQVVLLMHNLVEKENVRHSFIFEE